MAELIQLEAAVRPRAGKGAARAARREGLVPAVIYGAGKAPESITLNYNEVWRQYLKGKFTARIFELTVEGKKQMALARDVQLCPVRDTPLHVDFMRVADDGIVRVAVPVHFLNETQSPGLKRGGVLNIVRHHIDVNCHFDHIPDSIDVDLNGAQIGDSIHISSVSLPDNVTPVISDRDFTIATITGKMATAADADETTASAEADAEKDGEEAKKDADGDKSEADK